MEKEELEVQRRLADAAEKRNKLYEIEVLCKAAEAAKSMAKCSLTSFHEEGYYEAEDMVKAALIKANNLIKEEGL